LSGKIIFQAFLQINRLLKILLFTIYIGFIMYMNQEIIFTFFHIE